MAASSFRYSALYTRPTVERGDVSQKTLKSSDSNNNTIYTIIIQFVSHTSLLIGFEIWAYMSYYGVEMYIQISTK